jgi:hypothetical protein
MKCVGFPVLVLFTILSFSCRKEQPPRAEDQYTVPATYDFSDAGFTASSQRLQMLNEMTGYIKTAHSSSASPVLDAQKMSRMFSNLSSPFSDGALNLSGVQIKDQCDAGFQNSAESFFTEAASVSKAAGTASDGKAGKLISGTKAYLVDKDGGEYKELLEKGVMRSVFYSKAMKNLNTISSFSNEGDGYTAQEEAWDEAFGYFGVPVDFPANTSGLKFWGSYCNSVNPVIGSNAIMNSWLKGRAAIAHKDDAARDEAAAVVVATWEKIAAARCITYLKGAKTNFSDDAVRCHNLSEALGFIRTFSYNSAKKISDAQISQLNTDLGTNFYQVTTSSLDKVISSLSSIFGLDSASL